MAEKERPIRPMTQPIYLGIGEPMPTPRIKTNSMFGKVEDAFSGRSLQFEEEAKAKEKEEKKKAEKEKKAEEEKKIEEKKIEEEKKRAEEEKKKTEVEEEKSEDMAADKEKKTEVEVKTVEVKTEEVKTEEVKTEEVKTVEVKTEEVKTEEVKTEEVKEETEAGKVVLDLSSGDKSVSAAYLLCCFILVRLIYLWYFPSSCVIFIALDKCYHPFCANSFIRKNI